MDTQWEKIASGIQSKDSFLAFLELLIKDLKDNPGDWENRSLADFLEALHRWADTMEAYYRNTGQPVPTRIDWKVFADMLLAARCYE
ncbi:DUF7660 family protein [Taibaiella koreensis]|uniref:DUF7660 family protein n=1 Tax=Taibaiella koreensis TaxID=1268548 RepID=UPI000E59F0D1|nr:hypothetical protein [Taibaiella koreensis]